MNSIKQRITSGWNLVRVLYVIMGIAIIVQSFTQREWTWTLFGIYFSSMGLFVFGCAGGACYHDYKHDKPEQRHDLAKD